MRFSVFQVRFSFFPRFLLVLCLHSLYRWCDGLDSAVSLTFQTLDLNLPLL